LKNTLHFQKVYFSIASKKIHTCRGNYELWKKRIDEVHAGRAELSLRYWSGSPYNSKKDGSKQIEFARLGKNDGIGIQLLMLSYTMILGALKNNDVALTSTHGGLSLSDVAKNDGLSLQDFKDYFKGYDLSEPLAIIHFTKFRY
jgi:hypothetical protein